MCQLIRTDLAVESTTPYRDHLPKGVEMSEFSENGIQCTHIKITDSDAAALLNRSIGNYITVELPSISSSVEPSDTVTHLLSKQFRSLIPETGTILVVGLGNERMTPDAIGPQTAGQILATRHLSEQFYRQTQLPNLRPVSVISPGVLGQTGMETSELICAIIKDLHPAAVVAVDALASRSAKRLGSTIQLSDSGISPGSGVCNARKALNYETLGIPVISAGIPTVIDAATLIADFSEQELSSSISDVAGCMMVTPRDIDAVIERGAKHLSLAINAALQPNLSLEEITYLVS